MRKRAHVETEMPGNFVLNENVKFMLNKKQML